MTLGTHLAFASVLYLGGATLFGYRPDWVSWLLAAVASLLPDIDLPPARIGRLFWFVSVPLERRFGHRTLTHSAVMLLAVALLASPLGFLNPLYFWAVVGGYWSHLWLDMLNVRGIDLFWPSPIRLVTPGNRHWRFQVGGRGEMILLAVLIGLTVALYPLSHLGFRDGLQALLKNFDIAREQYQRVAGTHWYTLELTATDPLTLQPVQGRFPVVGVWQNGLIVAQDGTLRAVGPSLDPPQPVSAPGPADPGRAAAGGGGTGRAAGPHAAMAGQPHRSESPVLPAGRGGDSRWPGVGPDWAAR
jgi:inner membrane protein